MTSNISYILIVENKHHSFTHRVTEAYVIYPDNLPHESLPKQKERNIDPPVLVLQ